MQRNSHSANMYLFKLFKKVLNIRMTGIALYSAMTKSRLSSSQLTTRQVHLRALDTKRQKSKLLQPFATAGGNEFSNYTSVNV